MTTPPTNDSATAANCLHAAQAWLQRIGADAACVAVVQIAPAASVAVWNPEQVHVGRPLTLDDAAAEVAEAAGPTAARVLQDLAIVERTAVFAAVTAGARMELLVAPAAGEVALRLVHEGRAVFIGGCAPDAPQH